MAHLFCNYVEKSSRIKLAKVKYIIEVPLAKAVFLFIFLFSEQIDFISPDTGGVQILFLVTGVLQETQRAP